MRNPKGKKEAAAVATSAAAAAAPAALAAADPVLAAVLAALEAAPFDDESLPDGGREAIAEGRRQVEIGETVPHEAASARRLRIFERACKRRIREAIVRAAGLRPEMFARLVKL